MLGRENLRTHAHRLREQTSTTLNYTDKGKHPQTSDFALANNRRCMGCIGNRKSFCGSHRGSAILNFKDLADPAWMRYQYFVKWRHRLEPEFLK